MVKKIELLFGEKNSCPENETCGIVGRLNIDKSNGMYHLICGTGYYPNCAQYVLLNRDKNSNKNSKLK